jgi:predicted solute-binding protein
MEEFKSKFFKNEAERDLWLKLNAEHQIAWEKGLTWFNQETQKHEPTLQALNPRTFESALEIAKNQLAYDEKEGKLRHTLEDYFTKDTENLNEDTQKAFKEFFKDFDKL